MVILVVSAGIVLYAYLLYPLLLWLLRARAAPATAAGTVAASCPWPPPSISITLPAFNARATIRPVLDALIASDYPTPQRQILVLSDASDDGTDALVLEYATRGVELLRVDGRRGKTALENLAFPFLRGQIVINTDASVIVHPLAVQRLVAAMQDPTVGVASGRDVSIAALEAAAGAGESAFVGYEMWVRALETEAGGIVGASGCLYAIRAPLHRRELPGHLSRDFASALWSSMQGFRSVSVADALCYVPRAASLRIEFRRKIRTMSRGLQTLFAHGALLNPSGNLLFAWKLWSHKLLRWTVPIAVAAIGVTVLSASVPLATAAMVGVLGLAVAAWYWPVGRRAPRLVASVGYLVTGVVAGLIAWVRALRGQDAAVWEPTPRSMVAPSTTPRIDASADVPASG